MYSLGLGHEFAEIFPAAGLSTLKEVLQGVDAVRDVEGPAVVHCKQRGG